VPALGLTLAAPPDLASPRAQCPPFPTRLSTNKPTSSTHRPSSCVMLRSDASRASRVLLMKAAFELEKSDAQDHRRSRATVCGWEGKKVQSGQRAALTAAPRRRLRGTRHDCFAHLLVVPRSWRPALHVAPASAAVSVTSRVSKSASTSCVDCGAPAQLARHPAPLFRASARRAPLFKGGQLHRRMSV
jgi:hypothetical protein